MGISFGGIPRFSLFFLAIAILVASAALAGLTACGNGTGRIDQADSLFQGVKLAPAFPALSFERPVDFQHAGDSSGRLFVVEQQGLIYTFSNQPTTDQKSIFLDIRSRVEDSDNEEGLLGLAFHPAFAENGYFFVNYTASDPDVTRISRFQVDSADANQALASSEKVMLELAQPAGNHNGGQLAFGPEGYLYIGTGDGGGSGDPHSNGQNRRSLLGKILRINVDRRQDSLAYLIPHTNPYTHSKEGYRGEIFAYGLRNPWRFSFDPQTGYLWAGDVGQNQYEEIDLIVKGGNYGWKTMEGMHCFSPDYGCKEDGLKRPVVEYDRRSGFSVTGGYVYRGQQIPTLVGKYVYGDYVSGRIWALDINDPDHSFNAVVLHQPELRPASFGIDEEGELYVCSFQGKLYKFVAQ